MRALTFALLVALAPQAQGQDVTAGLQARLALFDRQGRSVAGAEAEEPLHIVVTLTDALTGSAPRNIPLIGWVRAADPANPDCEAAVRAFRATRALPHGTVDLNGALLAVVNRDASLGILDPKLNLRSSNMIAARRLSTMPKAVATDSAGLRVLIAGDHDLRAIDAQTGEESLILENLPAPSSLLMRPDGGFWLADGAGVSSRRADGTEAHRFEMSGRVTLRALPGSPEEVGAFSDNGQLRIGSQTIEAGARIADAVFLAGGGIVTLAEDAPQAELRFRDAPTHAVDIPLGIAASRLAASADGATVLAYSPGKPVIAVIDVASARLTQSFALDAPVTEIAATANALYILSLGGGYVAVMQGDAALRRIPLAGTSPQPEGGGRLLLPLDPAPRLLAVDPALGTGWIIHDMPATAEIPPMETVRLRGGIPHAVHLIDRSLRETAPGRFETRWRFPAGPKELVLTTADAGGMSLCLPFDVNGEVRSVPSVPVKLALSMIQTPTAGVEGRLRISVRTLQGQPVALPATEFMVPSLVSGWRGRAEGFPAEDGMLELRLNLPHAGAYALQPLDLPPGIVLTAVPVVEIGP